MSYPTVINELASAVNAVVNVMALSVLKILPVLVAMLIGLVTLDMAIGSLFEGDTQHESPFISESGQAEMQLTANEQVHPGATVAAE